MSKPDVAILIIVLAGAGSLLVALLWVTGQVSEEIKKPNAANWITPVAKATEIPSGAILIFLFFLVAAVFLSKGILWGGRLHEDARCKPG